MTDGAGDPTTKIAAICQDTLDILGLGDPNHSPENSIKHAIHLRSCGAEQVQGAPTTKILI